MIYQVKRALIDIYLRCPASWRLNIEHIYARMLSIGIRRLYKVEISREELEATRYLSIIVPVHNAPQETERCFRSLERFKGEAEVIIVDDGSMDIKTIRLIDEFVSRKKWSLHRNEQGSGHSRACMDGARLAKREILFFLNSDTMVTHRSWAACVSVLMKNPMIGVVGPRISAGSDEQLDVRAKRCRHLWDDGQILYYAECNYRVYENRKHRLINRFIDGAALAIRRADWEIIGGFFGCRRHFGNDVDLCKKMLERHYMLAVADAAYIHHIGGRSGRFVLKN